eukprot:5497339-Pyramimonas_sp.AAC.1
MDNAEKADGQWKAAQNRHNQLVEQVLRLRKQLALAEKEDKEASVELARADAEKRQATTLQRRRPQVRHA